MFEDIAPLIAAFGDNPYAGKNAKIYRRMRANLQRRDDEGQFAFQGGMGGFNVKLADGRVIRAIGRYIGESGNTLANSKAIFHVTNDPNLPDGFYLVNGNNIRSYAVTLDKLPEGMDVPDVTGKAANNAQDIATLERLDAPPGWTASKDAQGRTVLTTDDKDMRIVFPAQEGGDFELYKGKGATAKSKNKNLGRIFDAADDLDLEDDLSDPESKAEQKDIKSRKNKVLTRLASDNPDERAKAQAEIEGILSEQESLRKATPVAELTKAQAGDVTEGGLDEIEQDNVDKQVKALKKIRASDLAKMPVGSKITINRKGAKGVAQELVKSADGKWREPGNPNYAATDRQLAAAEVLTKADENTAKDILGIYEGPAPRKLDGSIISKADFQAAIAKLPATETTEPTEDDAKAKRSAAHKLWQAIAGLSDKMSPFFARARGNAKAIAEDKELQALLADWKSIDTDGYRRRELQNMWDDLREKARGIDDILAKNPNSTNPQIKTLRDFRNGPIQDRLNELSKVAGDLGNEVQRRQREGVAPNVSGKPTHDIGAEKPEVEAFRTRGITPTPESKKEEWNNKEPWQQWGELLDRDAELEALLPSIFDNPENAKKFDELLEEMRQIDVDGARRIELLREAAQLKRQRDAAGDALSGDAKKAVQDRIDALESIASKISVARINADQDDLGPVTDRDPIYDVDPETEDIKNFRENGTIPGTTETTETADTVDGPAKWREFAELYKKLRDAMLNKIKEVPAIKKALRALDADYAQQEDLLERRADVQHFLDNPPEDLKKEQRQEAEYLLENIDDALKEIEDTRAAKQAKGEAPAVGKPTTDFSTLLTNQEGEVQIPKRPKAEEETGTQLPKPGAAKPAKPATTEKPKSIQEQWDEAGELTQAFFAAVRGGDAEAAKAIWKELSNKYPVMADWMQWAAASEDPDLSPEERKKLLTALALLSVGIEDAIDDGVDMGDLLGLVRRVVESVDNPGDVLKKALKKGFPEIAEPSSELSTFVEVARNVNRIDNSVLDKAKPGQTIWYRDPANPEAGHKLLTKTKDGQWVDADGNIVEIASPRKDSDVIDGIIDQSYIDAGIADAIDDFASVTDLGNSGGLRSAVAKIPKTKAGEKTTTTSGSQKDEDGLELNPEFIAKNVQVTTDEDGNITAIYEPGEDVGGLRLKITADKATNKILVEILNRHGRNLGKYGPYDVKEGDTLEGDVQKWIKFFSDKLAKHHKNGEFKPSYETLPDKKEEEETTTDGEGEKEQESTEDPEEVKKRWASVDELFNAIKDMFSRLRSGEFWSNNPEITEKMDKLEGEDLDGFLLFDISEYKDSIDRAMLAIRASLADMPDSPEKERLQAFHDLMQEKSNALKQWIEATNSARTKRREDGLGPNTSGAPLVALPELNDVDTLMSTGIPPEGVNIPGYTPPKPGEERKPGGGGTRPPEDGDGGGTTPPEDGDGGEGDGTQPPPRPKRPRWVWERTPDPAVDPTRYMNMYEVRRWMRRKGLQTSYPYTDSDGNRRMRSGYRVVQRENGWVDIYYDVDDDRMSPEEARAFAAQKVAELTAMLQKDGRWEFRGPRYVRREVFDDGTPTHDGPTPPGSPNAPDGASGAPESGSGTSYKPKKPEASYYDENAPGDGYVRKISASSLNTVRVGDWIKTPDGTWKRVTDISRGYHHYADDYYTVFFTFTFEDGTKTLTLSDENSEAIKQYFGTDQTYLEVVEPLADGQARRAPDQGQEREQDDSKKPRFRDQTPEEEAADAAEAEAAKERAARDEARKKSAEEDADKKAATPNPVVKVGDNLPDNFDADKLPEGTVVEVTTLWGDEPVVATKSADGKWRLENGQEVGFDPAVEPVKLVSLPDGAAQTEGAKRGPTFKDSDNSEKTLGTDELVAELQKLINDSLFQPQQAKNTDELAAQIQALHERNARIAELKALLRDAGIDPETIKPNVSKNFKATDSEETTESSRETNADGTRGDELITEEVTDADIQDLVSLGLPTPDSEQKRVIEGILSAVLGNKIGRMVVQALAGSGKTATLVAAANILARRSPDKKGLYVVFNIRAADEGRERMPLSVESRTGDSLAASWIDKNFAGKKKLFVGETSYRKIAEHFGIKDIENGPKAAIVAKKLLSVIDRYSASDDDNINELHFVNEYGIEILPFTPELLAKAQMMWEDLQEVKSFLSFNNNHAVKMWALTRPDLSQGIPRNKYSTIEKADFILVDEAQDTNPVLAKVYRDQVVPVIFVGDSRQAIYGFRGAVDELDKVNAEVILPIRNTYRMGQELAGWANGILSIIGSKFKMRSKVDRPSEVAGDISKPDLIITFTRNGLIDELLREEAKDIQARKDAIENGQEPPKPRIFGITSNKKKELRATLEHYKWLKGLGPEPKVKDGTFKGFSSWDEVMAAALQPDADTQLVKLVSLMVGSDPETAALGPEAEKLISKYNAEMVEDFLSRVVSSDGGMWSDPATVPFRTTPGTRGKSKDGTVDFNIQQGPNGQILMAISASMDYWRSLGGWDMDEEGSKAWKAALAQASDYVKKYFAGTKNQYWNGSLDGPDVPDWDGEGNPARSRIATFKNQADIDKFFAGEDFAEFIPETVEIPGPKPDIIAVTAHEYKGGEANRVQLGDDWGRGRAAPKFFTNPVTGEVTTTFPARETMRLLYVAITRAKEALGLGGASWIADWITDDSRNPDVASTGLPKGAVWPTKEEQDAENKRRADARDEEERRREEQRRKKKEEEDKRKADREEAYDGEGESEETTDTETETEPDTDTDTSTEEENKPEEETSEPEQGPFPGPKPGSPEPEPETKREKNFWREFFQKILRDGVTDEDVDTIIAFLKEGIDRYARPIIKNMLQRMASLASKGMNSYYAVRNLRRNAAKKISEIINGIKYDLTHPVVLLPEAAQEFLQKLNNVWIDLLKSIRKNFFESPSVPPTAKEESENPDGPNPPNPPSGGGGPDDDDNNNNGGGGAGAGAGGNNILVLPEDLADDKNPPTIFVRDENTGDIETYEYVEGVGYVNVRTGDILTKDDVVDDSVYGNVLRPGEEDAVIVEDEEVVVEPQKELPAGPVRPQLEAGQNEADFEAEGWERVETDDVLDEEINKIALQDVSDLIQDFGIDNLNFDSTEENNKANEAAANSIKKLADVARMAYRGMRHFRYGNVEVVVDGKYSPEAVKKLLGKAKQLADQHPIQKADGTPTRFWIFETADPNFAGGFTAANGDIIIPMNVANINNPNHVPAQKENLMPAFNELAAKGRWFEYPMAHEWGHALMAISGGGFNYSNAGKKLFELSKVNPGFIAPLGAYGKKNINEGGAETFAQWHFQQNGDVAEVEILQEAIDIILGNDGPKPPTPVDVAEINLPDGWTVGGIQDIDLAIENLEAKVQIADLGISADEARKNDPEELVTPKTLQFIIDKATAERDTYAVQLETLKKHRDNLVVFSVTSEGGNKDAVNLFVDNRMSSAQVQEILDNLAAVQSRFFINRGDYRDKKIITVVDDASPVHNKLVKVAEAETDGFSSTTWELGTAEEGAVASVTDELGDITIFAQGASTLGAELRRENDGKQATSFETLNEQGKWYLHEMISRWATKLYDFGDRAIFSVKIINAYMAENYLPFAKYIGSLEMDNIEVFGQMFADNFFASDSPAWMSLFSPNSQLAFTGSTRDFEIMRRNIKPYEMSAVVKRADRSLTAGSVDVVKVLPQSQWRKITPEEYAIQEQKIHGEAVQRERDRALQLLGATTEEVSAGNTAIRWTQATSDELSKITKSLLKGSHIYQLGETVVIFPKDTPQVVIDQNLAVIAFSEFMMPIGGQVVRYLNRSHQSTYAHSFVGPLIEAYKGIHLFDSAFMSETGLNSTSTVTNFHPPVAKVTPMAWTVMVHEWVHAKDTVMPGPFAIIKEGRSKSRLIRPHSNKLSKLIAQNPSWKNKYVPSDYGKKNYNEFLAELVTQVSAEDFLGIDVVERPQELTDLVREMYSPEALELALANEAKRKEATTEVPTPKADDQQNMPDVQDAAIWTPAQEKAKEFFKAPVNIGAGELTKAYAARTLGTGILEKGVTPEQLGSFMSLGLRARELGMTEEQVLEPISGDTVDANNTAILKLDQNGVFSMEKTSDFLVRNNADLGSDMSSVPVEFVGEVIGESKKNSVEMTALAGTPEATKLLATAASSFILEDWADVASGSGEAIRHPLQAAAVQMFPETLDNQIANDFSANSLRSQEVDPVVEAAAQVMYDNTQQFFKDQGISEITVYRGVGGLPGEIYDALLDGNQTLANQLLTSFPLSSWSTDQNTAWDFAQSSSDSGVLRRTIPVSQVFTTPLNGIGTLGERELILLGGAHEADVQETDAFDTEAWPDSTVPAPSPTDAQNVANVQDGVSPEGNATHYVSQDGTYGDARGIALIDASKFEDDDWETLELRDPKDRPDMARFLADMLNGTGAPTHYVATDGSYGDARGLALVDASKFTDDDWETLETVDPKSAPDTALMLEKMHTESTRPVEVTQNALELVSRASTTSEVIDILKNEIGISKTTGFDNKDINLDKVKELATTLITLKNKYPLAIIDQLSAMPYRRGDTGAPIGLAKTVVDRDTREIQERHLELNVNILNDETDNELVDAYNKQIAEGRYVKPPEGTSPLTSTIIHEFGHILDYSKATTALNTLKARKIAAKVQQDADFGSMTQYQWSQTQMSEYARTNDDELVAESFADVHYNGANASDISKAVVRELLGDSAIPAPSPEDSQNAPDLQDPKGPNTTGIFNEYNPTQRLNSGTSNSAEDTPLSELGFDPDEEIKVYRGVPTGVTTINPGDWVTTLPQLAKDYAGTGDVISMSVKAKDLLTTRPSDGEEPDTQEMVYRPASIDLSAIGVPDEPGTIPVPDGMVRLFHYTTPEAIEPIKANGLVPNEEGGSFKDAEPALIWANQDKPAGGEDQFNLKPVVEFYVSKEKWESGDGGIAGNALGRPVPAENIIAVHEPWHRWTRELTKRHTPEEIAGGALDQYKNQDSEVDTAISKLEELYKPEDASSESGAVTDFQDALDRIYAEASFQVMSDESPSVTGDRANVKATVADNIRDIMQQKGITWTQARELFLDMILSDLYSVTKGDNGADFTATARMVEDANPEVDLDNSEVVDLDVVVMEGNTPVTYTADEYLAKVRSEYGIEVENSVEGLQQALEEAADAFNEGASSSGADYGELVPDYRAGIYGTPEGNDVLFSATVSMLLTAWAVTSVDGTVSPALQKLVAEKFNVADPLDESNEGRQFKENYDAFIERNREALTAAIDSMYEQTQEFLKKQGITSVRAYRGMQINVEDDGTAPLLDEALKTPDNFTFTPYPLSSWSFNKNTAEMFARSDLSEYRRGMLIYADIPALDIFSIPYFGLGALDEYELVVTGGGVPVTASEVFPR